ncbi:MAG: endonuclease/exonuclease/phosphatase family protein [Acutalibacteraceae bacterium]|nr:endonuclease/exonuclease/phosphatase family protein [Acutalibacteraceae bacterium]
MFIVKQLIAIAISVLFALGITVPESLNIENVPKKNEDSVRIISFNVRCADDPYGSVENRSKLIVSALKQYQPDSFGVQEATEKWLRILSEELSDEYDLVTQFRDGKKNSEASAVFYLKDKYTLKDSGTIWLSDTPDEFASKYSLSFCPRIATWAVLENKETGEAYTHINTHLDHVLESVRVQQVKVLEAKINELKALGYPLVCTGDFNTKEGADAYTEMSTCLKDTKYLAKESDDGATYINYGLNPFEKKPIDFIFVSDGIEVDRYKIIDEKIADMYLSDHAGLCADINF